MHTEKGRISVPFFGCLTKRNFLLLLLSFLLFILSFFLPFFHKVSKKLLKIKVNPIRIFSYQVFFLRIIEIVYFFNISRSSIFHQSFNYNKLISQITINDYNILLELLYIKREEIRLKSYLDSRHI